MPEALDRCIALMREGKSLDSCIADEVGLADELRPLLAVAGLMSDDVVCPPDGVDLSSGRDKLLAAAADLAADALDAELAGARDGAGAAVTELADLACRLRAATIAPPAAPTRLERGRDRLLSAAADARDRAVAVAAAADGDRSLTDALDACVAGLSAGKTVEAQLAAHPHQADLLQPMLRVATRMRAEVTAAPPADLAAGRDRLLAAAAYMRSAAAAAGPAETPAAAAANRAARTDRSATPRRISGARLPRPSWLTSLLDLGRPSSAPRVAASALAVLALLVLGGQVVAPAAASSLPGDALYGVKRAAERMRLALAFDPIVRRHVEADLSRERADEIAALQAEGRAAEVDSWKVVYRDLEDTSKPGEEAHGVLWVSLLDPEATTRGLAWNAKTEFDAGERHEGWGAVPPGSLLTVRLEVPPEGLPLALAVRVAGDDDPTATPTATAATATPEWTITPSASPTVTETPVETPSASPTDRVKPTETGTATPPDDQSPTPAPTEQRAQRATLRGLVEEIVDENTWVLAAGNADRAAARTVVADVSRLDKAARDTVHTGDWVQLHGAWADDGHTRFLARAIDRLRPAGRAPEEKNRCTMHTAVGRIAEIRIGSGLRLTDGTAYDLSVLGPAVGANAQSGARVEIDYEDCGDGRRIVRSLKVLDAAVTRVYQGTVEDPADDRFILVTRSGNRLKVVMGPSTQLVGAASVENGQKVVVRGWEEGDVIHAEEVRVRAEDTPEPAPTAVPTDAPTAEPTAEPTENAPAATAPAATESAPGSGAPGPGEVLPAPIEWPAVPAPGVTTG